LLNALAITTRSDMPNFVGVVSLARLFLYLTPVQAERN
jgi:hypothetical protein